MKVITWTNRNGIKHTMNCHCPSTVEHTEDLDLLGYEYVVVDLAID